MMQQSQPECESFDGLNYLPGRFEYLMQDPFALEIWKFLKTGKNIRLMIEATELNRAAIDFILSELESLFGAFLGAAAELNDDRPVMVNNMIKQIMDKLGYQHTGCTLFPNARYIKASGMYKKRD